MSRSSFVPPTHRRSSARRAAVSVNSPRLSKSDSNSRKTPSISLPTRSNTVVSQPSLSARACVTSSWVVLLFVGEWWKRLSHNIPRPILPSAAYGVLRFVMESGAKGCEVVISGKLRAARAKSMKFTDGFMIHSGQPARDFVDYAVRHVMLRQGVLGIKVKM
jgi:hypothetical protein